MHTCSAYAQGMHCAYTGPQGVRRTSCWPLSADRAAPPRSQARRAGVAGGVGAPEVRHPPGVVLVPAARSRWPRSQQPVRPPITPGAHPDYSGLLPLGPRGEPSAGKGCLPGGGCCGALVPPQGRRFRRPLDRLGTTVRSSCGRSTRRASGGRCTSAASTRAPSTRSHGALWSTASAWLARPPMAG